MKKSSFGALQHPVSIAITYHCDKSVYRSAGHEEQRIFKQEREEMEASWGRGEQKKKRKRPGKEDLIWTREKFPECQDRQLPSSLPRVSPLLRSSSLSF